MSSGSMFSDAERLVFRYEVRGRARYADPLAVRRRLLRESAGRFYQWYEDSCEPAEKPARLEAPADPADPSPEHVGQALLAARWVSAMDSEDLCLGPIRAAFGLEPFDPETGGGVTDRECWKVLSDYWEWLEKNESPAGDSQTTSPADTRRAPAGP